MHSLPLACFSPLHADPGSVKNTHEPQHALQDVSDDVGGHAQRSDLRQGLRLDVAHRSLGLFHQGLQQTHTATSQPQVSHTSATRQPYKTPLHINRPTPQHPI